MMVRPGTATSRPAINENHQFIDVSAGTGEIQEGEDVTHVVVDDAGITEVQP